MYKISLVALLVFFCATFALAQEEYHKVEISAGYSHLLVNGIVGDGELFADDPDETLTFNNQEVPPGSTNLTANPGNLFFPVPFVYTGKRHRAAMKGFNTSAVYNFSKYVGVKFEVSGHYRSSVVNLPGVNTVMPVTSLPAGQCGGVPPPPGIICATILPLQSSYPNLTVRGLIAGIGMGDFETEQQHYNFLGGLQLKNNSKKKKFKPFAHVLAGASRQTVKFKDFTQREFSVYGKDRLTNTGFTMAFGGGIDIRLSRRIDLRVVQVDYNPVRIKQQQIAEFKQPITNTGIPNNATFSNLSTATIYSADDVRINSRWQNNFRIGFGIVFH